MFFNKLNGGAPNLQAPTSGPPGAALGGFGPQPVQQMSKPGYYGPSGTFLPPNITPPPVTMGDVQNQIAMSQGGDMGAQGGYGMAQGGMPQMPSQITGQEMFRAMLRGVNDDPNAYERRAMTPRDFA